MIAGRHFPRSGAELGDIITEALRQSRTVAVQSGHFRLYDLPSGDKAGACIASEMQDEALEQLKEEHAYFPHLTWDLACRVLVDVPQKERYLLVLVNDWQYVRRIQARAAFFDDHLQLPKSYAIPPPGVRLLTPTGPSDFGVERPYFSERSLRNSFHRRLKKMVASGELPPGIELEMNSSGAACSLVDAAGERKEIYCSSKSADCAGEVAELIDRTHELVEWDTFINFFPIVCKQFVELGTEAANGIFATPMRQVINVALPATRVRTEQDLLDEAEITIHTF